MRFYAFIAFAALTACSPQEMTQGITRKMARSVVVPVMQNYMTAPQAEAAADCIIANSTPNELKLLARDTATRAGTQTVQNIVAIVRRPATGNCMRASGIPPMGA